MRYYSHRIKSLKHPRPLHYGFVLTLTLLFSSLILGASHTNAANNRGLELLNAETTNPIKKKGGYGYLLLEVSVEGSAPSLEIRKLSSNPSLNNKYATSRETYKLDLKNKPPGFYYVPLKQGYYQVTHINAPFYNLPYKLDTKWGFTIVKNHINYAGKVTISEDRTSNSVDAQIINRFATTYSTLEKINQTSPDLPVRFAIGYEDAFAENY